MIIKQLLNLGFLYLHKKRGEFGSKLGKKLCFIVACGNMLSGASINAKYSSTTENIFLLFSQFFLSKQDYVTLTNGIQTVLIVKSEQIT